MRINEQLLDALYAGGKCIRQKSWPEGDYILADGATGARCFWYYTDEEDNFTEFFFGFDALGADDWEIM